MSKYFVEVKVRVTTDSGDVAYCYETVVGETGVSTGSSLSRIAQARILDGLTVVDDRVRKLDTVDFRRIG